MASIKIINNGFVNLILDSLKAVGNGAAYVLGEAVGLVGSLSGKVVRKFNDNTGVTAAVQEGGAYIQNTTHRITDLGTQAVANATDIADRATTNLTGLTLVAANHAATLGHRGLREVETWGDFLRSHTIATTALIGGIASEVVAVTMHRAYNELCEDSNGTLCSGLSDATLTMYKTGIVCIMVSGAYLFCII